MPRQLGEGSPLAYPSSSAAWACASSCRAQPRISRPASSAPARCCPSAMASSPCLPGKTSFFATLTARAPSAASSSPSPGNELGQRRLKAPPIARSASSFWPPPSITKVGRASRRPAPPPWRETPSSGSDAFSLASRPSRCRHSIPTTKPLSPPPSRRSSAGTRSTERASSSRPGPYSLRSRGRALSRRKPAAAHRVPRGSASADPRTAGGKVPRLRGSCPGAR
jgi:hypothetical protein